MIQLAPEAERALTPTDFFTRACDAFDAATQVREGYFRDYGVGVWRVRIRFAGAELVQPLTRALDHLRLDEPAAEAGHAPGARIDLTILAWTGTDAGQTPPPTGAKRWRMGPNGLIRSLSDNRFTAHWMFVAGGLQMLDRQAGRAIFWVRDAADLPAWETAAPMRFMLEAWFTCHGWLLVHGAAVGDGRGAVLLTGPGGSGKSSTALACLVPGFEPVGDSGLDYLADDYVALNTADGSVYSVYNSGKADAASLACLRFLEPHITNANRSCEEKGLVFVHEAFPHKVRSGPLPVRALVQPRIQTGKQSGERAATGAAEVGEMDAAPLSACRPVSSSAILKGLAASTILQSGRPSAGVLRALARLVRDCSGFELDLAPGSLPDTSQLAALLPSDSAPTMRMITVIIPCFNPGPYLQDALASVCAQDAARQEGGLEVIVVDDGSNEDIGPVLDRFDSRVTIRLLRQSQQGPSAARNRGLDIARGEFISFLDADDVWPAGSLQTRAAVLASQPDTEVVHGRLRNLLRDDGGRQTYFGPPRRSFNVGSMLFRRRIFDRIGRLNERLRFGEDVDFLVRIVETGVERYLVDEVCLYYRRHGGGLTGSMKTGERGRAHLKSWGRILKHSLDRRRA